MNTKPVNAATLFCCYAHEDEPLRDELEKHLAALKRSGHISSWHDRYIQAGTAWQQEIETHLTSAHFILLLISPDFLYSDACDAEMHKALALHDILAEAKNGSDAHVVVSARHVQVLLMRLSPRPCTKASIPSRRPSNGTPSRICPANSSVTNP